MQQSHNNTLFHRRYLRNAFCHQLPDATPMNRTSESIYRLRSTRKIREQNGEETPSWTYDATNVIVVLGEAGDCFLGRQSEPEVLSRNANKFAASLSTGSTHRKSERKSGGIVTRVVGSGPPHTKKRQSFPAGLDLQFAGFAFTLGEGGEGVACRSRSRRKDFRKPKWHPRPPANHSSSPRSFMWLWVRGNCTSLGTTRTATHIHVCLCVLSGLRLLPNSYCNVHRPQRVRSDRQRHP